VSPKDAERDDDDDNDADDDDDVTVADAGCCIARFAVLRCLCCHGNPCFRDRRMPGQLGVK